MLALSIQSIHTLAPTTAPSVIPSETGSFRQAFRVTEHKTFFTDSDLLVFQTLFEAYTRNYAEGIVFTICNVDSQQIILKPKESQQPQQYTIQLEYTCSYSSSVADVTMIPSLYILEMNARLETLAKDMQKLELQVLEAMKVEILKASNPIHRILQKIPTVARIDVPDNNSNALECTLSIAVLLVSCLGGFLVVLA